MVYFDIYVECEMVVFIMGMNILLLKDIFIWFVEFVSEDFYVCFSVIVCCYCYVIYNYIYCGVIMSEGVMYFYYLFDEIKM